jgi:hypothetical protein
MKILVKYCDSLVNTLYSHVMPVSVFNLTQTPAKCISEGGIDIRGPETTENRKPVSAPQPLLRMQKRNAKTRGKIARGNDP